MNKQPNVWRAKNKKTGKLHYLVGLYNESTGQYTCPLNKREKRRNPFATGVFGNFSYCCQYKKEVIARKAALNKYGYSKIQSAYGNLGNDYERIDK